MPIRASQRWFYPIDWPQLSRSVRFGRACGACERCGRRHGEVVRHLGSAVVAGRTGLWWDPTGASADHIDATFDDATGKGACRRGERGRWRCERGRVLPRSRLAPPDRLAVRVLQPAFWAGLEVPVLPVRESLTVLACCHLDHNPTNCAPANLSALCGRCHLAHDRTDNLARRRESRAGRAADAVALL